MQNDEDVEYTPSPMRDPLIGLVVGLGLLIAAGWLARKPWSIWWQWSQVEAQATGANINSYYERRETRRGQYSSYSVYRGQIEFRYSVGGKEYVAWATSSWTSTDLEEIKRRLTTTYAPGTRHAIRYNPADPSEIRIDLGYGTNMWLMLGGFLALGALFTAAGVAGIRRARAEAAQGIGVYGPSLWSRISKSRPVRRLRGLTRSPHGPPEFTVRCPWCGKRVEASSIVCPNCSRSLRAA